MGIQKLILNFILTIESWFISFIKIKPHRVTFISLETNELTSDFKLIYDELNHQEWDIRLCLIQNHKDLWGQFLYFLNSKLLLFLFQAHLKLQISLHFLFFYYLKVYSFV